MKKIILLTSLCAAASLFASDANYNWEVTPVIGGAIHEGNMDLKPTGTAGIRIAKNLDSSWIDQVEFGIDRSIGRGIHLKKVAKQDGTEKPTMTRYEVNVVKNIVSFANDSIKLYGLTGLGYADYSKKVSGTNYDAGFWQYGLGAKYYVTDNFALKLEATDALSFKKANHTASLNLGFALDFGPRNVAPAVKPAPVAPVYIKDVKINFKTDSAVVSPKYDAELAELGQLLKTHPGKKVRVVGHTDSTGSAAYNKKLSEKRAKAVAAALNRNGVTSNNIEIIGEGKDFPVATNKTKEGRAANRRVNANILK